MLLPQPGRAVYDTTTMRSSDDPLSEELFYAIVQGTHIACWRKSVQAASSGRTMESCIFLGLSLHYIVHRLLHASMNSLDNCTFCLWRVLHRYNV